MSVSTATGRRPSTRGSSAHQPAALCSERCPATIRAVRTTPMDGEMTRWLPMPDGVSLRPLPLVVRMTMATRSPPMLGPRTDSSCARSDTNGNNDKANASSATRCMPAREWFGPSNDDLLHQGNRCASTCELPCRLLANRRSHRITRQELRRISKPSVRLRPESNSYPNVRACRVNLAKRE